MKTTDLANFVGGTPERFVPELMSGDLIEPEHVVRYWWAAGHATDRGAPRPRASRRRPAGT